MYKDSISLGNKVAESALGTPTGAISVIGNATDDVGSTNTYIVVVEGALAAGAGTQDWTLILNSMTFNGGTNTVNFENVGSFPITEVK